MAGVLDRIEAQPVTNWLNHADNHQFYRYLAEAQAQFKHLESSPQVRYRVALANDNPVRFLANFTAIHSAGHSVFFCNPDWGQQEWQQAQTLMHPHAIVGYAHITPDPTSPPDRQQSPLICIPTGGTSGRIKFASHTWHTLTQSTAGFQQHFDRSPIHSFCLLPLFHVSGFMQFVRSLMTGGQLYIGQSSRFLSGEYCNLPNPGWFISLVPTQLKRAMTNLKVTSWLSQCEAILLGGAPAWPALLEQARSAYLPLAPTYGATETASQLATLLPYEFLAGKQGCAPPLPHVSIQILDKHDRPLSPNKTGRIAIQASSLALGYFPKRWESGVADRQQENPSWVTDDIGFLDDVGYLHVLGRNSDKILTGGENVYPVEVESAIRSTQLVEDVAVLGLPDEDWGEAVSALCVLSGDGTTLEEVAELAAPLLARYKRPKRWMAVKVLPRNDRGKIDRQILQNLAQQARPLYGHSSIKLDSNKEPFLPETPASSR
ncbi:MAG: AMP-binding protein [Synechococcus sp.]